MTDDVGVVFMVFCFLRCHEMHHHHVPKKEKQKKEKRKTKNVMAK